MSRELKPKVTPGGSSAVSNQRYSVVKESELPAVIFNKQLAYKRLAHSIFKKTADCLDYLKFVILDV